MFTIALSNVLLTLCYMLPAYLLCKCKKVVAEHLSSLSALLVYVGSPCLALSSLLAQTYTRELVVEMLLFFAATLLLQIAFLGLGYLLLRRRYTDAKWRILNVGALMGNVGFFGLPMVRAILPNNPEVMCFSAIFSVSMNVISFTVAIYCLTGEKKYITPRAALLNPPSIASMLAILLVGFGVASHLPVMVTDAVTLLGRMTTPLCMFILGIRLATVPLGELFTNKFAYLVSAAKLLVFPLFCYAAVVFLPLSFAFKASMLILSATPCASMILNLAELHHSAEAGFCANCVLLSTLLCSITLPILALLL